MWPILYRTRLVSDGNNPWKYFWIDQFWYLSKIVFQHLDIDQIFLLHGAANLLKFGIFGYFQVLRGLFAGAAVITFLFIMYERILATFKYKTYETYRNLSVIIVPVVISPIWTCVLGYLYVIGVSPIILILTHSPIGITAFVVKFLECKDFFSSYSGHIFTITQNINYP